MRRAGLWIAGGILTALVLTLWGVWTWRLTTANRDLSLSLEADRQRNFADMAYHVEQIQSLLGKGLVAGTTRQNMRYLSDAHHHAAAAAESFMSLPLPAEVGASVGKFLQQTGDFAISVSRNEAAGREMDEQGRQELARLRAESANLSARLQEVATRYNQGGMRWSPPVRFTWGALLRGAGGGGDTVHKPPTQDQAPSSLVPGGWDQVGSAMERLPVMIYDGPFSDHLNNRTPATQAPPISREDAERLMRRQVPGAATYRVVGTTEAGGNLPTFSFQVAPATTGAGTAYTASADIARNGGYLVQWLNSRVVGKPAIDLDRARALGLEYLTSLGFANMVPTYGQATEGTATIAYAYRENGVLIYPDQIKVKVALDNGEILAVDARQYLMSHHPRDIRPATVTPDQAEELIRPELTVDRTQLTLIPSQAGTGEILAYEFLTRFGEETFLIYVNAYTGQEEQILQQVQTDGGTFAL
ncbi:MAG TPA: germination protein YpeB [Symbiobacteriaceae bacterium]|nr:germination protein YpeB [Symbiobacteriaceae bacterium]